MFAVALKDGLKAVSDPGPEECLIKQPLSSAQFFYRPQLGASAHEVEQPIKPEPQGDTQLLSQQTLNNYSSVSRNTYLSKSRDFI